MTIMIAEPPLTPTAHPMSRLRNSLVRHASTPLTLEARRPSEGSLTTIQQHPLSSPKTPTTSPGPRLGLLNELSLAQSLASRLSRDRDNWRSLAHSQEQDLLAAHNDLKQQAHTISEVEAENAQLRVRHEEDTAAGRQLSSRFHDLINKHDKLVERVNDALRAITRLKKSDRSKGKVQQRNLRLKATLQRYTAQGTSATTQAAADTEATLREALALANERIEELESTGEVLLDALEKSRDGDDGEEMKEEDVEAELLEAEVAFRGVVEDESFVEQRENWADLLNE